jgi:hypothetical protein
MSTIMVSASPAGFVAAASIRPSIRHQKALQSKPPDFRYAGEHVTCDWMTAQGKRDAA